MKDQRPHDRLRRETSSTEILQDLAGIPPLPIGRDFHGDFCLSRRDLLLAGASSATPIILAGNASAAATERTQKALMAPAISAPSFMNVSLQVNGQAQALTVDTRTTLLDLLREQLHLTGTKKGCDHGQCGACTVMAEGRRINSCLSLAVMHEGTSVVTIEGLGTPKNLHPMQVAFVEHDGYQCGYCTPGQICSAVAVLDEIKRGIPSHVTADLVATPMFSADELRERMSGNICRCGAYSNIVEAITAAAGSTT